MRFGQLIEYSTRNIFLQKLYIKFGEETIPRLFPKNSKLSVSLDEVSSSLCLLYAKLRAIEIY